MIANRFEGAEKATRELLTDLAQERRNEPKRRHYQQRKGEEFFPLTQREIQGLRFLKPKSK